MAEITEELSYLFSVLYTSPVVIFILRATAFTACCNLPSQNVAVAAVGGGGDHEAVSLLRPKHLLSLTQLPNKYFIGSILAAAAGMPDPVVQLRAGQGRAETMFASLNKK